MASFDKDGNPTPFSNMDIYRPGQLTTPSGDQYRWDWTLSHRRQSEELELETEGNELEEDINAILKGE
jgi:YD repeat-containing protein